MNLRGLNARARAIAERESDDGGYGVTAAPVDFGGTLVVRVALPPQMYEVSRHEVMAMPGDPTVAYRNALMRPFVLALDVAIKAEWERSVAEAHLAAFDPCI